MAATASIIFQVTSIGMRNGFEKDVSCLLPISEGNNKGINKRAHGTIYQLVSTVSSANADKARRGTSDIEYRFHSIPKYKKLGEEERRDIHQWRKENPKLFPKEGKQVEFEKGTRKGKVCMLDKPDCPDSKKKKQAR